MVIDGKVFFNFQLNLNMSNISFAMGRFSYQTSRITSLEHLFLMDFDDFLTIYLILWSKSTFSMVKVSLSGNTLYLRLLSIKGCDAIRPELTCFILMILSVA